jgi:caffeoyl-CoA O-methyltransferase
MAFKSIGLSDDLHAYLLAHNPAPDPVVTELIERTHSTLTGVANLQIAPEQAPFLTFLTRLVGVRTAVEVGTFTGLSALSIARGLVEGGRLICFDISTEYTDMAREFWAKAGVDDRIELRIGPATQTLNGLPAEPHIDLAFIDADKESYPAYWELLVPRMSPGGVIVVDNVLRGGRVLDPDSEGTKAIVAFNDVVSADSRVDAVMIAVGDGLTLARRL